MSDDLHALGASDLVAVMGAFRDALSVHRPTINRLNVFPVPDGDTGTNMLATVESVLAEITDLGPSPNMNQVCTAIAQGSLMGARGNSGVILCQILRALAKTCEQGEVLGAETCVVGLRAGSDAANEAVLRPIAGTILTVAAAAAAAAEAALESATGIVDVVDAARTAAVQSLAETPTLLSVLAEAGVVDAGGAGLIVFYDALLSVAARRAMPEELALPDAVAARVAHGVVASDGPVIETHAGDEAGLRYEVMYLLEGRDDAMGAFKEVWAGLGDSIVVVGGDGLYNCHIHTNDIGAAIEAALDVGRPRNIAVTDLDEQVQEEAWVRAGDGQPDQPGAPVGDVPVTSVVTVASGEGIRRIFSSLGVHDVVPGGQSMNPSTAEILANIEKAPGKDVVILPNNTNIYPVAAQAAEPASKAVYVVATAGIQEGFAALLEYDPAASGEDNAKAMATSASHIVPGEVTQAVRATTTAVGEVGVGDFIGLSRHGIESIAATLGAATIGLLQRLLESDHEIVTLIEGAAVAPGEVRHVSEWLSANYPKIVLERLQGGQPLYPFLLSIE